MAFEKKEAPKSSHGKNIVVLAAVWITFFIAILSNANVRKYLASFFSGSKYGYYGDVIFLSPSDNVFTNGKVYYDKKPDVYDIMKSPFGANGFFAATNYGLFLSSNNGLNWEHVDLPKEIGAETPIYRIFSGLQSNELLILVLNGNNGTVYETYDNFYSIAKVFAITKEEAVQIIKNRNISTIIPMGNGKFVLGTTK